MSHKKAKSPDFSKAILKAKTSFCVWTVAFFLAVLALPAGAKARTESQSLRTQMNFIPLEVPWATVSKDSVSLLFTAYLTLPDTLAGWPMAFWLDTTQTAKADSGLLLWRKPKLSGEEAQFLKALRALLAMNWLEAGQGHRRGLDLGKRSRLYPAYLANSGLLFLALGERAEGEARLRRAASLPGKAGEPAWRSWVNLALALGKWNEADSLLSARLAVMPAHDFAARAKSFLLRQDSSDQAYEDFLRSQTQGRKASPGLRKVYGSLLLERGRYREAAQMFQRAVESDPKDGDAWVALGRAFQRQELWIFAEESFRHALSVGTRDRGVFDAYAQVLMACCLDGDRGGREQVLQQARELLERGVALQISNRSSARLLFNLYGLSGRYAAAAALRRNLWFHFEGPDGDTPRLGSGSWFQGEHPRYLNAAMTVRTYPLFLTLQKNGHLPFLP